MVLSWTPATDAIVELARSRDFAAAQRIAGHGGEATVGPLATGRWFWRVVSPDATSAGWSFTATARGSAPARQATLDGSDFDGDGRDDLPFRQAVYLGRGTTIRLGVNDNCSVSPTPGAREGFCENLGPPIAAGDVDGDGFDDLVALLEVGGHTRALFYRGAAGLDSTWTPAEAGCLDPPRCALDPTALVRLGDVNGDGRADLGERGGRIFLGSVTGPQPAAKPSLPPAALLIGGGDFDGDGIHDVAARRDDNRVCLHAGATQGFKPPRCVAATTGGEPGQVVPALAIADLDADGRADLLGAAVGDAGRLWWMKGGPLEKMQIDATLVWPYRSQRDEASPYLAWTVAPAWGGRPARLVVIDDPSPGDELFVITLHGNHLVASSTPRLPGVYGVRRPSSVGDVDGDGMPDLLVTMTTALQGTWMYALLPGRLGTIAPRAGRRIWHVPFDDTVFPREH